MWFSQQDLMSFVDLLTKLILASLLGGVIGLERESLHRPAGFRTHILVCVASALVMVTSVYLFDAYGRVAGMDPSRLATNVLAGIGFIGAGTILKQGFNVKGLTTAASLWSVACVGLAVGIGFYTGAIATTVIIYLTLVLLRVVENYYYQKKHYRLLSIESENNSGCISKITGALEEIGVLIRHVEFTRSADDKLIYIKVSIKTKHNISEAQLADEINKMSGIRNMRAE